MKFQDFKYNSVEEMLQYLPPDQLEIVETLREIILESIPGVNEKLSFNVPFYSKKKSIAFIWPGAIPWGKKMKEGVEFGLTKAYLMAPNTYINLGQRKQIGIRTIFTAAEIDSHKLKILLHQAVEIDFLL